MSITCYVHAIAISNTVRLGGLLALGFGEAGAEVIGQNMKATDW